MSKLTNFSEEQTGILLNIRVNLEVSFFSNMVYLFLINFLHLYHLLHLIASAIK